jgi:hypothetical protein
MTATLKSLGTLRLLVSNHVHFAVPYLTSTEPLPE